jgi:MOSC domain-containing protein YiiM
MNDSQHAASRKGQDEQMTRSKVRRQAKVVAVLILEPGAQIVSRPLDVVEVTPAGFAGDRHAGLTRKADVRDKGVPRGTEVRNDRQVTIVSQEELTRVAQALDVPEICPEWLGANLCLAGLDDLSHLPSGSELKFGGGASLRIEAKNRPCKVPGEAIQAAYPQRTGLGAAFPKAALGLRGLVATVHDPGRIAVGDPVEVELPT